MKYRYKLKDHLLVGGGGFLGAVSRYELGNLFKIPPDGFPFNTFIINLSGSFVLGFVLTLIVGRTIRPTINNWRLFLATGFIGAYTTFSSFAYEILTLYRQGNIAMGLLYSFASLSVGLLCVWLGARLARRLKTTDG